MFGSLASVPPGSTASSSSMFDDSGRPSHLYGDTGPGATLVLVSFIGISVSFPLLLNRFIWRFRIARIGLDDFFTFFAWLFLLALSIVSYEAVNYGYGRPQRTLTRTEAASALRMFYVYQILYKSSINLSKLSILSIYLRVFGADPRRSWFPAVTYVLIIVIGAYTIASLTSSIFECTPIRANWDVSADRSRCINTLPFWYANAIYNIVTELLILLSAIIRIWSLSPAPNTDQSAMSTTSSTRRSPLTRRDKYSLSVVFALGFFTVATAILRMTTLKKTQNPDRTAGTLVSTIWSTVEASCAIVCANLPMLRIVFKECPIIWVRRWLGGERKYSARYRGEVDCPAAAAGTANLRSTSALRTGPSRAALSPPFSPALRDSRVSERAQTERTRPDLEKGRGPQSVVNSMLASSKEFEVLCSASLSSVLIESPRSVHFSLTSPKSNFG